MVSYAADSLIAFLMSITAGQVNLEYCPSHNEGSRTGLYVGLLFGALFWGISADMIEKIPVQHLFTLAATNHPPRISCNPLP